MSNLKLQTNSSYVDYISSQLEQELDWLNNHKLYSSITTMDDLREFMRWHVFAVWDFMSLLKTLQIKLTGMNLPWQPPEDNASARLINDIVLNEETDINLTGSSSSHLELYLDSMEEIGADISNFRTFSNNLTEGNSLIHSLLRARTPQFVQDFVCYTINTAQKGSLAEIASSFVFGRETVIPDMFQQFLNNWGVNYNDAPKMHYYLSRHIEIDADEHGPAAIALLNNIISRHPKNEGDALKSAKRAIAKRISFWDGIHSSLKKKKNKFHLNNL